MKYIIIAALIVFALLAMYAPLLLVLIGIGAFLLDRKTAKRMSSKPTNPHDSMDGPR